MARLYGKDWTRTELRKYLGDLSQIARAKPYRLTEGREDGVSAIEVTNGSGLQFTVLPGRGMDISSAAYNGMALNWRSSTSDVHSAYFDHEGENGRGWLRSFSGGLVATCGLASAGASSNDGGTLRGLHGRIGNTPAYGVYHREGWIAEEYEIEVGGKVRETTVFGENFELTRVIKTRLGSRSFSLEDTVENLGFAASEIMLLYHINLGFPFVNDHSRLLTHSASVVPRDDDAKAKADAFARMQPPEVGYRETCYFHDLIPDNSGCATAAVYNPNLPSEDPAEPGLGVYVKWPKVELPRFTEWKMMGAGTYVVGMEPSNCSVLGRVKEREAGTLQWLEAGERKTYSLEIGLMTGSDVQKHF